jgi:NAD(P)-dependent dehydrogenase (short-subunit alcohol dehydrogenase family)
MPVIAIVAAGCPGLGLAIARRFGRGGYRVALISRDQAERLYSTLDLPS